MVIITTIITIIVIFIISTIPVAIIIITIIKVIISIVIFTIIAIIIVIITIIIVIVIITVIIKIVVVVTTNIVIIITSDTIIVITITIRLDEEVCLFCLLLHQNAVSVMKVMEVILKYSTNIFTCFHFQAENNRHCCIVKVLGVGGLLLLLPVCDVCASCNPLPPLLSCRCT